MKKSLRYALSLAVMATFGHFSAAHAQPTAAASKDLDAASYGLLVKFPIRPETRAGFWRGRSI
ncbi:hypothetical protein [Cupriavidus basilensis]|uniref:Uncharacterized protein n=1 Tax=Cupriavidus basilensis TaxID=68895 RepID=A0A0C4YPG4_9BURK|nr:hypothetical protein [Cupriavidus basilensis]AJG24370.1 hypothetical protein RR42_s2789 [Cupriavidus basilensis]